MTKKKVKNELPKKNKVKGLYALVVYSKAGKGATKKKNARGSEVPGTFVEVLELGQIPKNHRVVGDRTRITRVDPKTNKSFCHYVIIKKISDNRDALLKMCPNNVATEEVVSPRTKIFASEIISEKNEKLLAQKAVKVACLTAWNEFEEAISKDRGVWGDATAADTSRPHVSVEKSFRNVQTQTTSSTPCSEFADDSSNRGPCNTVLKESTSGPSVDPRQEHLMSHAINHELIIKDEVAEPGYDTFWASMEELAAVATPQNIAFLESVVISLKASLVPPQVTQSAEEEKLYKIPERFKTPGKDKVPLFDGIPFYLFSGVKAAIQAKSIIYDTQTRNCTKNWRLLVRQCLIEVYGKHLTEFSAKGMKEGLRPAIDNDLYKGLLYWAREWCEDTIDEVDYVKLINKTAYNKRKSEVQRHKKENEQEKRARIQ